MRQVGKISMVLVTVLTVLVLPTVTLAKPRVSVSITAEKEVAVMENGKTVKKKVPATQIDPGNILFYTVSYINSGDEVAKSAVIDDAIPQGTAYSPGSAFGENADITFSIDGGKTFRKSALLTYDVKLPNGKTETRRASPDEYTHIRWVIDKIAPSGKGIVGFQVKVK